MPTVMVWSSNAARLGSTVWAESGATTTGWPTGTPLTVEERTTGRALLLTAVMLPRAEPIVHRRWASRATAGGPGAQSTVTTRLVTTSPSETTSIVTVWFSRAVSEPVSVTVSLPPGGTGPTVSTTVPSTRIEKLAGAVASASFETVTATLASGAVHSSSLIVASGSGPTSGGSSQPLCKTALPSGQLRPRGRPGRIGA